MCIRDRVFNMGVGFVVVIPAPLEEATVDLLAATGETAVHLSLIHISEPTRPY